MLALLLSVNLVVAASTPSSPSLELDLPTRSGPVSPGVLTSAAAGAAVGDVLVLGLGYGVLQLFAAGVFEPSAGGFRNAAFAVGAAGLVVPPLVAALFARWAHGDGPFWRAALYALAGQAVALGVGWAAWPRAWAFPAVQFVTVGLGSALGLRRPPARLEAARRARAAEPADPPALAPVPVVARPPLVTPVCPDG